MDAKIRLNSDRAKPSVVVLVVAANDNVGLRGHANQNEGFAWTKSKVKERNKEKGKT